MEHEWKNGSILGPLNKQQIRVSGKNFKLVESKYSNLFPPSVQFDRTTNYKTKILKS